MLVHFLPIRELRRMDDYKKNVTEMAFVVSMMTVSGIQQREAGSGKREAGSSMELQPYSLSNKPSTV